MNSLVERNGFYSIGVTIFKHGKKPYWWKYTVSRHSRLQTFRHLVLLLCRRLLRQLFLVQCRLCILVHRLVQIHRLFLPQCPHQCLVSSPVPVLHSLQLILLTPQLRYHPPDQLFIQHMSVLVSMFPQQVILRLTVCTNWVTLSMIVNDGSITKVTLNFIGLTTLHTEITG